MTPPSAQADVRLRRRLSDKDKERRLVRRSSSKRKDKENGDGQDKDQAEAESAVNNEANNGGVELTDISSSRGSLKRTSSVEGNTSGSGHGNNHALLCRTRSEDAASSSNEVCEAGLTRSLPRI